MEDTSEPVEVKQGKETGSEDRKRKNNVWRGTPTVWQRCVMCELNKKCSAAGVVRGSKACADARYALMKR